MWNFTLRRITSLVILTCALAVIFLAISYFPGFNKMPLLKRNTITSKMIHLKEPVILQQAGYMTENEGVMMMELLRPSAPDLYPTPRRPRRGTPDSSFGTYRLLSFSLKGLCHGF